jgi:NADH:ubiquinone oxidoreductase subunit 6 (subunit J)
VGEELLFLAALLIFFAPVLILTSQPVHSYCSLLHCYLLLPPTMILFFYAPLFSFVLLPSSSARDFYVFVTEYSII